MIKLYEDNAGGLYMTDSTGATVNIPCVESFYDDLSGALLHDLSSFNEWAHSHPNYSINPTRNFEDSDTYKLIATYHQNTRRMHIYLENMGKSGNYYAGLNP